MPTIRIFPGERAAHSIDVAAGTEIVVRGVLRSTHDGSLVDAGLTTSGGAAGSALAEGAGLVDFAGGGFRIVARDRERHEVRAIATGARATACEALGVASPCLPLRVVEQARTRMMTTQAWADSLVGSVLVDVPEPPSLAATAMPWAGGIVLASAIAAAVALSFVAAHRRARSPRGQLLALALRVQTNVKYRDPVLAGPLLPLVASAHAAVRKGRVDATSAAGRRIRDVLEGIERQLDRDEAVARRAGEGVIAADLSRAMQEAMEAANEARHATDAGVEQRERRGGRARPTTAPLL